MIRIRTGKDMQRTEVVYFVFTFRLVTRLKQQEIRVLTGCSDRRTIEYIGEDGRTMRKMRLRAITIADRRNDG